jgi:hypothetical protein
MSDMEQQARAEVLARLRVSREEILQLLDPPPGAASVDGAAPMSGLRLGGEGFPRSRTMRALMSSKGLTTLGAAAAGLLIARPALALRLVRLLPASAFAKMLLTRAMSGFRAQR